MFLRYSIWWRRVLHKAIVALMSRASNFLRENDIKLVRNNYIPNGKPTIFSSAHGFYGDVHCILSILGESAFLLYGGGFDRVFSAEWLGLWLVGCINVERYSKESRRKSLDKIIRILDKKGNILIFPEGSLNNSPNLLVKKMHWGLLDAAKQTNANIVPVAVDKVGNVCRVAIGEIFDYSQYPTKQEQIAALRDEMAALTWGLLDMNPIIKREDINIDYWVNRINKNYEIGMETAEEDENYDFKPKGEISLGELLAQMHGIEYKSMAADYETHKRIEKLIKGWTDGCTYQIKKGDYVK